MLTTDDESSGSFGMVDGNGTYQLKQPVPKGTYKIFFAMKGYALETGTLILTTNTQFNATLVPGGDIRVTVRKQGKPMIGKTLHITTTEGANVLRLSDANAQYGAYYQEWGIALTPTDEQGQTTIRGLKPGQYSLSLEGEKTSTTAEVKPLETAEAVLEL